MFYTIGYISTWDEPDEKVALQQKNAELWRKDINDELKALMEKQVYKEVQPTEVRGKALASKLVCKIKHDEKGNIEKYLREGTSRCEGLEASGRR
jgi:hypothetical protein